MPKAPKILKTFRLSDATVKELEQLANRHKISQTDVLSVLIHSFYMGFDEDATNEYLDMASKM